MTHCQHCNQHIIPGHWRNQSQVIVDTYWIDPNNRTLFCRATGAINPHTPRKKIR